MRQDTKNRQPPNIIVSETDHQRLTTLATAALSRIPDVAGDLLSEMDRARIVRPGKISPTVIQMGSVIEFQSEIDDQKRITLVYPGEADIAEGKISILTPLGTALIGLSQGQSVMWTARNGRQLTLNILAVEQPTVPAI
ncbi:regulator of nucleoside diphosphate kinase [Mesorhizobium albiziae]|uniref:Regulator of nucleoside diphosphate kinase n=1 Tax=Neomesorhizobium albiziae TaxID=335020 RepID=A0A1I3XMN6_9HYPH|nr:nucleoside diphosphate kinase regulator [Mesorhizobium albiziae]GLS30350.1 nucleoside diphosphate kinase regulator [Mesorhizobium albiziae]SFK20291.1 regulator of nucleoside diphosphate kinase [Mesorhizobium albiziae]